MHVMTIPCLVVLLMLAACSMDAEEPQVVEQTDASITMCATSRATLLFSESIARDHCGAFGQVAVAQGDIVPTCSHTNFFDATGYMQEYQCVAP